LRLLKEKATFMILVLIVGFISFSFSLQGVSAENRVCCEKTKENSDYNGASCIFTTQDNCDPSGAIENTICEDTTMCSPGCCIKEDECVAMVLKGTCLAIEGAVWKNSENCAADVVPQCQEGCCMLSATNAVFTTQAKCRDLVEPYTNLNLQEVFDVDIQTEVQCILKARGQEQGCCLTPDKCSFTIRANCPEGVEFKPDTICSYSPLGCECTEKAKTGCRDGFEEVYWFDSCGNPENIYGAIYRGDGKVVNKEEICIVPDSDENNNAGSVSCGNCDYSYSSICVEADDNFLSAVKNSNLPENVKPKLLAVCSDLKCYHTEENPNMAWMDGRTRENGESWCEYEGAVGNGLDLVGSRHILHQCINGKEIVTACQEKRKEICVQGEIPAEFPEIGGQTSAICKPNFWASCLTANDQSGNCNLDEYRVDGSDLTLCGAECDVFLENDEDKSSDIYHFGYPNGNVNYLKVPGIDSEFREDRKDDWIACCEKQLCRKEACGSDLINTGCYWNSFLASCLPATPIGGFGVDDTSLGLSSKEICDIGDISCSEVWVKTGYGSPWKCVENCGCHDKIYGTQASNFCRSLGDCGAYYNVVGSPSSEKSFKVTDDAPKKRKSGFWGETETFGIPYSGMGYDLISFTTLKNVDKPLNGSILLLTNIMEIYGASIDPNSDMFDSPDIWMENIGWIATGVIGIAAVAGVWGHQLAARIIFGTGLGAMTGGSLGAVGFDLGRALVPKAILANTMVILNTIAWVVGAIILLITLVKWILSLGYEDAKITYNFNCNPWVPPLGGGDCEQCDDFEFCDEYKCKSLGAHCELKNIGSAGLETCVGLENDMIPPIINPHVIAPITENDIIKTPISQGLNGGYEFKQTFDSFSEVEIGIDTWDEEPGGSLSPEPAICKISSKPTLSYDEMLYYFDGIGEDGAAFIKREHIMTIPYLANGLELDPDEDRIVLEGGKTNTFYVKCINTNGIANIKDYFIKIKVNNEPDGTAPVIEEYSLRNGAILPSGINSTTLILYTDELTNGPGNLTHVGGCRWSNEPTTSYTNMVNDFVCSEDRVDGEHYSCGGILSGLQNDADNIFYFKCRDVAGNINQHPQPLNGFHLYLSEGLDITAYSPLNQPPVYANGATLEVQTSGGANGDGTATCYYSLSRFFDINSIEFENTGGSIHAQEFATLASGEHTYYAWCEDSAGNGATQEITFTLLRDEDSPELDRIYVDGTRLYIQLNEAAECEYSLDGPFSFGVEGNSQMEPSGELTHFCQLAENGVYNIVCQDSWENQVSFVVYP